MEKIILSPVMISLSITSGATPLICSPRKQYVQNL